MKKKHFVTIFFLLGIVSFAQIRMANSNTIRVAVGSSAFIDASSNSNYNSSSYIGKGLLFPRTNLSTFSKFGGRAPFIGSNYPSGYDGFLVYNTYEGTPSALTGDFGTFTGALSKGFYYYDDDAPSGNVLNGGTWKKLGASNIIDKKEEITNLTIDGSPVYSFKGSFTADGSTTQITLSDLPADTASAITSLYRVTIYNKDKKMFTNTVYSFDATNRKIITGAPNVSVVYEAGNYNYILEYLK